MGILRPDQGRILLLGEDPSGPARDRVGYLPEERGLYRKMKILEQLVFIGRIRGLERREAARRAKEWLERLGLGDRAEKTVDDLSKGVQQKVQFIATVIHEPEFLILDEPFSGLDPINQDLLEQIVREQNARGVTILFSTHLMEQAERLCERVCLISHSRKILDGDLREIRLRESGGIVEINFEGPDLWLSDAGLLNVEKIASGVRVQLREGSDPHALLERAVAGSARIRRFQLMEPRLHEIFVRHVTEERGEAAGLGSHSSGRADR
jgi:ABC-2 type transport system ATP-binding protein